MGARSVDVNRAAIETVLADLELALTFAQTAAISTNPATRDRNRSNASEAFVKIRDELLPLCHADDAQYAEIEGKLHELKLRLRRLGQEFS